MRSHSLRAAAPKGPWTPASITTALWFDAADSGSITLNGSNVSQWNDKSGNNRHVLQATAGAQPSYATQINGRNVVTFDGGDVLVSSGNIPIGLQSRSVFIVYRENSNVASSGILAIAPSTGEDYNSAAGVIYETGVGNNALSIAGSTLTYQVSINGASSTTALGIYGEIFSGTSGTPYANGTAGTADSSFTAFNSTSSGPVIVGGRFLSGAVSANYRLNGAICEIIYCESALSQADRQKAEGYLAHKWGLTGSLAADHPYKSSPP